MTPKKTMTGPAILSAAKRLERCGLPWAQAHKITCEVANECAKRETDPSEGEKLLAWLATELEGRPGADVETLRERIHAAFMDADEKEGIKPGLVGVDGQRLSRIKSPSEALALGLPTRRRDPVIGGLTLKGSTARGTGGAPARPVPGAVDLSGFPGRNETEQAIGYLRSQPGGSRLSWSEINVRAAELVRSNQAAGRWRNAG